MMTKPFLVIGAGISGLTAAFNLARSGRQVILVDSAERVGGVMRSENHGGYLIERGPNSFSSFPSAIVTLIHDVGLDDRVLMRPMARFDRYIWKAGRLRKVPTSPASFVTSDCLSVGEKLTMFAGLFAKGPIPADDLTLSSYFRPRIGNAAVDSLLKPFLAGVYASDADRVSFESTFPRLFKPALTEPSLVRVMKAMRRNGTDASPVPRSLISFPGGVSEFPEAIAAKLRAHGGSIRLGVRGRLRTDGSEFQYQLEGSGEIIDAARVLCTAPADEAATILAGIAPAASDWLRSIEYAPLTVAYVGLREDQLTETRNGFGFLTVRGHDVRMLGMIWSDRIFPNRAPDGHRLLTCFYGGEIDPEACSWDEARIRQELQKDLKSTMGWRGGEFPFLEMQRWARALPIFRVGHMKRAQAVIDRLPDGLSLQANYLGGVSVPDRVRLATEWADQQSTSTAST